MTITTDVQIGRPQQVEQSRARYPDEEGYVERDGVRTFYEVYGSGGPTILFLTPWSIVHSRCWKAQIPYFARHGRVVTFDARGNGKSDQPRGARAYDEREYAADALAVMDATGTESAVLVSHSRSAGRALLVCAEHPERVEGAVFIGPRVELVPTDPRSRAHSFKEELDTDEGWAKFNRHYWRRDYRDFLEFFFSQVFTEPHSTKQIEDCVGWGLETTGETLALTVMGRKLNNPDVFRALCERITCPVLVIHGTEDAVRPFFVGEEVAEVAGGTLAALEGAGHCPHARDPVRV